jgi:hypothetical protein
VSLNRLGTAILFFISGGTLFAAFSGVFGGTDIIIYIFIFSTYMGFICYRYFYESGPLEAILHIFIATIVGQLIVIDPVEPGLYGTDSYMTLTDQFSYLNFPLDVAIVKFQAWPLFFTFFESIQAVLGLPLPLLAKYVPLITSLVPVLVFLTARRLLPNTFSAVIVGMSAAATKTLLLFETKFVDETIGVVLFFTALILIFSTSIWAMRGRLALLILSIGIVFSHPIVALVFALLGFLIIVTWYSSSLTIPIQRLIPNKTEEIQFSSTILLIHIFLFGVIYLLYAAEYTVAGILLTETGTYGSGPISVGASLLIADYFLMIVLVSFAVILLAAFLSDFNLTHWELALAIFCGVLSTYFVMTVAFGKLIGLSQSRIIIFLLPVLFLVGSRVLLQEEFSLITNGQTTLILLMVIFLISQIAALPPHITQSDPTTTIPDTDRSQTVFEQRAIKWMSDYGYDDFRDDRIYYYSQGFIGALEKLPRHCSAVYIHRADIPREYRNIPDSSHSVIYTNDAISFGPCYR